MASQRRELTVVDRTTIARPVGDGWGIRRIATALGRSPGTVSDEVCRNGGKAAYEAVVAASLAAANEVRTGRNPRMAPDDALFDEVARLVGLGFGRRSRTSDRRKREEARIDQTLGLCVSHETIYAAIYTFPRGELRRELIGLLCHATPRQPAAASRRAASCAANWSA
jgi:IS30 family transposase